MCVTWRRIRAEPLPCAVYIGEGGGDDGLRARAFRPVWNGRLVRWGSVQWRCGGATGREGGPDRGQKESDPVWSDSGQAGTASLPGLAVALWKSSRYFWQLLLGSNRILDSNSTSLSLSLVLLFGFFVCLNWSLNPSGVDNRQIVRVGIRMGCCCVGELVVV